MSWFRSSRSSTIRVPTSTKVLSPDLQQLLKQSEYDETALREMDDQTKEIAKMSRKVAEANARLNASETKLVNDLCASEYVAQSDLRAYVQQLKVAVYQLKDDRDRQNALLNRLVDDPFKKLSNVVGSHVLETAFKKREDAIGECGRFNKEVEKYEARDRSERTGETAARVSEKRRLFSAAQEDVRILQNRIVEVLPQINSAYLDYATPALITALRCEADTYSDAARSYTELRNVMLSKRDLIQLDNDSSANYSQMIEAQLAEIRKLSIVGAS